jgi:hypothetical protein
VKGDRTCPERHKNITFLLKTETQILEKAASTCTSVSTLSESSTSAAAPAMCEESPH